MASSSSSRRGRRRDRTEPPPPPPATLATEARDWASLPRDILLDVFLVLGPCEVMLGAEHACKAWRGAALQEPTLWRRIGMDAWDCLDERWRRVVGRAESRMRLVAMDRAKGQCEAFQGKCHDNDLTDLVERAPSLRSLHIEHYSDHQTAEALAEALQKLTLLEDLEIDFTYMIEPDENMLRSVCEACPGIKKLVLMYVSSFDMECNEDEFCKEPIDGAIPVMRMLHTLKLYDCDLSKNGLNAILDSCPLLETLYIDGYFNNRMMDQDLRMKCTRVKNLTLDTRKKPHNSFYGGYATDEYYDISSQEEDSDSEDE